LIRSEAWSLLIVDDPDLLSPHRHAVDDDDDDGLNHAAIRSPVVLPSTDGAR
jgi:hypothetical protein